jgi:hypothetical protein
VVVVALLASAGLFVGRYGAALAPPTAWDELAYHLPEARVLIESHQLPLNLGGHWLYGNLPKLVEVLFAESVAVSDDYALPHLLHLSILAGLLLYAFGTVRTLFGAKAAASLSSSFSTSTTSRRTRRRDTSTPRRLASQPGLSLRLSPGFSAGGPGMPCSAPS